ncbi:MAG: A24 family peptidase, partial [Planctomycetota bacterium]|nr:A24 family peptidase [Planctomycetota bacterium]
MLITLLLVASVTDIRQGQIFNWITYPGLVAGLLFGALHLSEAGRLEFDTTGLTESLLGIAGCGGIMLACFLLSDMGGGDVKLLATVGAFLGLQHGLTALLWTIVLGGVAGLALLIWQVGAGRIAIGATKHLALVVRSRGWVPLEISEREPLKRSLFLAPAALAGVLLTVSGATE